MNPRVEGRPSRPPGNIFAVNRNGGACRSWRGGREAGRSAPPESRGAPRRRRCFPTWSANESISCGIERIGDAELEERERVGEAELLQRVLQIRIGERGADEADAARLPGSCAAGDDAVDAVAARAGPEAFVALGKSLLAAPGAGRQQDVLFKIDLGRVELDGVVRVDAGKMIAPDLHRCRRRRPGWW